MMVSLEENPLHFSSWMFYVNSKFMETVVTFTIKLNQINKKTVSRCLKLTAEVFHLSSVK